MSVNVQWMPVEAELNSGDARGQQQTSIVIDGLIGNHWNQPMICRLITAIIGPQCWPV